MIVAKLGFLNGVAVALVMGFVNAAMACVVDFGVNMNQTQQGALTALVNAGLVLAAAAAHNSAKHTQEVIPAGPVDQRDIEQHD